MALSKKIRDGMMDKASARKHEFCLKQMIHMIQYASNKMAFSIKYKAKASSDHQPNQVPGGWIIMKVKQPNLPICSIASITGWCHLFSNPALFFQANMIFGIIIMVMMIKPKTLIHSILNPPLFHCFNHITRKG